MPSKKLRINYYPEITSWIFGREKPSIVSVNLTDKCNQRCVYCEIGRNTESLNTDTLTKEDLRWIIDQMALHKMTRLSMCGGEPFLFQSIIEVVAYAWSKYIRCNITSNGMTIHKLNTDDFSILKRCETAINISVDSFLQTIQAQTRGVEVALQNAMLSIDKLKEKEIPVTVLSAISKYNYLDLYSSLIKAYELGITQVLYQPIISYSNYPDKKVVDNKPQLNVSFAKADIVLDQLQKIYKFERIHKINTNVYRILPWIKYYLKSATNAEGNFFFFDVLKKFYCREAFAVIDISYYGGIQPCGLSLPEINIKSDRSIDLLNLWSDATKKLKYDLNKNRFPLYCNGCCHKFGRNMLASVMKYPLANRKALIKIISLLISRTIFRLYKNLFITK